MIIYSCLLLCTHPPPTPLFPHLVLIPSLPEHLRVAPGASSTRRDTPDGFTPPETDKYPLHRKDRGGKTGLGVQRTWLTPAASTRVKTSQTWGPPTVTSCSLLPLRPGFPMESRLRDGVGNSASSQKSTPHPTPLHPTSLHLGRSSLESRSRVCQGREDAVGDCRICILPSPGSPSGRPHPAPSSRSTLTFRQP